MLNMLEHLGTVVAPAKTLMTKLDPKLPYRLGMMTIQPHSLHVLSLWTVGFVGLSSRTSPNIFSLIFHLISSTYFRHVSPKKWGDVPSLPFQDFLLATWTLALAWSLGSSSPGKQSEISSWCLRRMKQLPEAQLYHQNLFHTQLG